MSHTIQPSRPFAIACTAPVGKFFVSLRIHLIATINESAVCYLTIVMLAESTAKPGKLALIVDDEAAIRLFIKAVLQQHGFDTLEAADGLEALQLLRNNVARVDLLLSDIRMPHMDGIGLARAVRAEFPGIPLILVSGYSSRDEAPDLDVHFIPKPFNPATLLAAIGSVMTQKKEPRSEAQPKAMNRKSGG